VAETAPAVEVQPMRFFAWARLDKLVMCIFMHDALLFVFVILGVHSPILFEPKAEVNNPAKKHL
jgi:hypothetical protein